MWPKNATIIGISPKATFHVEQLQAARFVPAGDLEIGSAGFSPVRDDQPMHCTGRQALLHYTVEKKHIPSSAVKLLVEEKAAELAEAQGFQPGKKARAALKEQVIDELLPRALSTRRTTAIWIDTTKNRITIDSTSNAMINAIQSALIKAFGDIGLQDVSWPRAKVLTEWLAEPPTQFTNDDCVALQYPGEKGKLVKYTKADLYSQDVQQNLKLGAQVQSLAMTYNDAISFVMTDNNQIRRIRPLDTVKEGLKELQDVDRFDGEFALVNLQLGQLIDELIAEA